MFRGGARAAVVGLACAGGAWIVHAQDTADVQSCEAGPRPAALGEVVFAGVGEIERLSWPADRSPVPDESLRAAASGWAGAPLDIATVRCAGLAMEAAFREAGYPYTRVSAPPQRVEAGLVRYQVVEGWIERVAPAGEDALARLQAFRRLRSLEAGDEPEPLPIRAIEHAGALLDMTPGLVARMSITRGGEERAGAIRVVADAEREERDLLFNLNNFGADELGRSGASLLFSTPGRAPLGDRLTVSLYQTLDVEEQTAARVTYERGLTASGLLGSAEVAWGEAEPGGEVGVLGAAAESLSARFVLSHPVRLGRTTRVRAGLGFDGADQSGELFGGQVRFSEDSSRNLFARLDGEAALGCVRFTETPEGACWRLAGEAELRRGLKTMGASERGDARLARPFANPQANVLRLGAEVGTPRGPGGLRASLMLSGQVAEDPLMAFEEFVIGNYTIVRGYDPGAAAGDSGAAAAFELIGPELRVRRFDIEPFGFYDAARIWNEDPTAINARYVASVGAGVRVSLDRGARLEAMWARPLHAPLGAPDEPTPGSRVLFSITTSVASLFGQSA